LNVDPNGYFSTTSNISINDGEYRFDLYGYGGMPPLSTSTSTNIFYGSSHICY
jgi:hypothetical protein